MPYANPADRKAFEALRAETRSLRALRQLQRRPRGQNPDALIAPIGTPRRRNERNEPTYTARRIGYGGRPDVGADPPRGAGPRRLAVPDLRQAWAVRGVTTFCRCTLAGQTISEPAGVVQGMSYFRKVGQSSAERRPVSGEQQAWRAFAGELLDAV